MAPPPALSSLSGLSAAGVAQMDISFPHSRPRSFVRSFVRSSVHASLTPFLPSFSFPELFGLGAWDRERHLLVDPAGR